MDGDRLAEIERLLSRVVAVREEVQSIVAALTTTVETEIYSEKKDEPDDDAEGLEAGDLSEEAIDSLREVIDKLEDMDFDRIESLLESVKK